MIVRQLPGKKGYLIDPEAPSPPNLVYYNPSATHDTVCMRLTEHSVKEDLSDMLLCVKNQAPKKVSSPYHALQRTYNTYKGLEDMRIVEYNHRLWFTASCTHASSNMLNELVVGYFNDTRTSVEKVQRLHVGPLPVKNICPFVVQDKLLLLDVYQGKVFEVCYDVETCAISIAYERTLTNDIVHAYGKLRGSSSPVHLHGNTWGCVVHSIIFNDGTHKVNQLAYMHHWMEFDVARSTVTYISTPFWCMHWGVEFISGCVLEKKDESLEPVINLYLGVRDKLPAKIETTLTDLRIGRQ